MDFVSKEAALLCLERDWAGYAGRIDALAPAAKEEFLQRQGFARLAELLAHIDAWWGEALANIRAVAADPQTALRSYDVDRFNAEAVRAAAGKSEKAVAGEFEETRKRLAGAISALTEPQVRHPEIQKQLYWMVSNHYAEHRL